MSFSEKIKCWFKKNKKHIVIGGTALISVVGTGIAYVVYKNNKFSFEDWLPKATMEELHEAYDKLLSHFNKTGIRPIAMEKISHEIGARGADIWNELHPQVLDPNNRWTDANRWD